MFYPGDTYNFFLNIPTLNGTVTVTSAPTITILNILNPGTPVISGASMTLVSGTSFVYYYSFTVPGTSPADYVAIYSYATSSAQVTGTATAASWANGVATYTFPRPLPSNAAIGNQLTVTGFTPSGFNVTAATIIAMNNKTGQVSVAMTSNPGSSESFNLTGNAQIVAGIPNVATVQVTQITNGQINVGDSVTIASATSSGLNGTAVVRSADLDGSTWTLIFNTTSSTLSSTAQSAGTLTDAIGLATAFGSGNFLAATTVSNQLVSLKDELHVGDSYVTGPVALSATVALNATCAKDATVFKAASYVAPSNDPMVQTINANVVSDLANTAALVTLLGTLSAGTIAGLLQDVYDYSFGGWHIDQTQNPPVLYINRINGSNIASFQLVNNSSATDRVVLTNPPESGV